MSSIHYTTYPYPKQTDESELMMSKYLPYKYVITYTFDDTDTKFKYNFDFILDERHNPNNKIIPKNSAIDKIILDQVIYIETLYTRTTTFIPIYNNNGFNWLDILDGISKVYNDIYSEFRESKIKNIPSLYYDDNDPFTLADMNIYDLSICQDPKGTKIIRIHSYI